MGRRMLDRWEDDDKIFLGVKIRKRLMPTIIGGIVGDALGVPVEFKERNLNVKGMTGYGTYNQPLGTWSDDTSLTMCLVENIIDDKNEWDLMEKFVSYREKGYWTPHGQMFDIGRTTDEAISRFKNGTPPSECGGISEYDNGNGALMRISPVVFMLFDEFNFEKRLVEIERISHLTHRHPRSTLGCIFYIEFLIRLFHNNSPLEAYKSSIDICKENLTGTKYENEFSAYERILSQDILKLGKEEIISDGYVVHTLEAALWCFLNHDSYPNAVLEAVNLGGDTDTIAFITGTMAGIYYKMDNIPSDWVNQLAKKDEVLEKCTQFFEYCFEKAYARKIPWKP